MAKQCPAGRRCCKRITTLIKNRLKSNCKKQGSVKIGPYLLWYWVGLFQLSLFQLFYYVTTGKSKKQIFYSRSKKRRLIKRRESLLYKRIILNNLIRT